MGVPDAKRRIAEAALALFAWRPYESVTVKDICRSAGCARSTFYEHFRDKIGVLHYLFTERFAWPGGIGAQGYPNPVEALLASPCRFIQLQMTLGPGTMRHYYKAQLDGRQDGFFEHHQEHNTSLASTVRKAQRDGFVTSTIPAAELACLSIFALSHLSMTWACCDGSFDLPSETFVHLCNLYGLDMTASRSLWEGCMNRARYVPGESGTILHEA